MTEPYVRKSILAPYIDALLIEKRANGFIYDTEEYILNRFDAYCIDHHLDTLEISKEFLSDWMKKLDTEKQAQTGKRISIVRQLLLFMTSRGMKEYIPHDFRHSARTVPHIFDQDEITEFFQVVDTWMPPTTQNTYQRNRRLAIERRLMFRLYCCCGLRNSEVTNLACEDADLENGVLTIRGSKGNKDRLVYLSEDLRQSCEQYYEWICRTLGTAPHWMFPASNPEKRILNSVMDDNFDRYWKMTRYANCSNKPTIHDFRFTFVVNRLNLWAEQGLDLQVMMPYLSRYLGHTSVNETFYYYYLVSDAFRTINEKDRISAYVLPEVKRYEH